MFLTNPEYEISLVAQRTGALNCEMRKLRIKPERAARGPIAWFDAAAVRFAEGAQRRQDEREAQYRKAA